jgi:hypothetical protein
MSEGIMCGQGVRMEMLLAEICAIVPLFLGSLNAVFGRLSGEEIMCRAKASAYLFYFI